MKQVSPRVAGLGDHRTVPHRDRVHPVPRLDDPVAANLDDDRVHPRSLIGRLVADGHQPPGQTRARPRNKSVPTSKGHWRDAATR